MKFYHSLFILVTLLFAIAFGQDNSKNNSMAENIAPLPAGVSIYQLDNGMEVLFIEKHGLPMTGVNVVVKVGSAYESFASSGMSHMLEHLLFNGTDKMSQKELYDAVDKIGGYNNANTDRYYTNYMMVAPRENFEKGMKIQAAMLFRSLLPINKFEKEKGIVLEEIAKSLGKPSEQINRNIISVLYPGHALSLPTLGTYETIKGMDRDQVYAFYKNFYVPNNMRMTVVGDFNREEMLNKVREIYGKAKPGQVLLKDHSGWATGFSKIDKTDARKEVHHLFYKGNSIKLQLFYPLPDKMNEEFFSLMDLQLNDKKSDLKEVLAHKYPDVKVSELKTLQAPISSNLQITLDVNRSVDFDMLIKDINEWISDTNFKIDEVTLRSEIVKSRTSFIRNTEKPHMFGIYNARAIAIYGFSPITDSFQGMGYYDAANHINHLKVETDPLVLIQYPQQREKAAKGENHISTELIKGNGQRADLIVRQVENGDILAIHILLKHKKDLEIKYGKNAAKIWNEAFGERLKKEINNGDNYKFGFKFTVNDNPWIPMDDIYMHPDFAYIRAEALAENISGAIHFLTGQMSSFMPTEEEYKKATGAMHRASGMRHQNKASTLFNKTWQKIIYEKGDTAKYAMLNYQSLLDFGKIYFHPANMIVSVVSPASSGEIADDFNRFTKMDPYSDKEYNKWSHNFNFIDQNISIEKEADGEQTYLYYGFMKKIAKKDEAPLKALGLLLKDDIVFDIREKRGMAYRMSAGIEQNNGIALFYIRLGTRPENAETLRTLFPSFFDSDFVDKINDDGLEKSLNMYLGRMMFRRLSSINQGFYLGESYYLSDDQNADEKSLDDLRHVKTKDVIRVAEKYLDIENDILIVVK